MAILRTIGCLLLFSLFSCNAEINDSSFPEGDTHGIIDSIVKGRMPCEVSRNEDTLLIGFTLNYQDFIQIKRWQLFRTEIICGIEAKDPSVSFIKFFEKVDKKTRKDAEGYYEKKTLDFAESGVGIANFKLHAYGSERSPCDDFPASKAFRRYVVDSISAVEVWAYSKSLKSLFETAPDSLKLNIDFIELVFLLAKQYDHQLSEQEERTKYDVLMGMLQIVCRAMDEDKMVYWKDGYNDEHINRFLNYTSSGHK